jgi:hypothetical protein
MLDSGRREFITLLGGAAAWPIAARARQRAMSTIGWLNVRSPEMSARLVATFHQGLRATGYLSGLPPHSDRRADMPAPSLRAKTGLMIGTKHGIGAAAQCNKDTSPSSSSSRAVIGPVATSLG